tara:strand:- start:267 stop:1691 length:1425 start_codon:yes stop_codon:yes gene_type:complete
MKSQFSALLVSIFIISACGGGGGGGGSDSAPTPSVPSIGISFSSSSNQVNTGDEIQLSWSSSNATSCSASGGWSGDKGISGNETILLTASGNISFSLNCSSASSSSSQSVSVSVNPVLNAYAYIDGPTTFQGFYVYKKRDVAIRVKSISVDFDINDKESLFITRFRFNEDRYLAGFNNDDGNPDGLGLRLGNNRSVNDAGEQTTYYIPQVSEAFHSTNQLLFNISSSINPYNYVDEVAQTFDDLELFNATLTLDFDSEYADPNSHDNIKMSLWATPKTAEDTYDAAFIGTSNSNDSYAFLYLVDQRVWDANTNNLASESDIFNQNLAMIDIFTSYRSQPNIEPFLDYGLVTNTSLAQLNNTSQFIRDTINGARFADAIDLTTNAVIDQNTYAIKYLQPESSSLQRIFLKSSLVSDSTFTNDCLASYNPYRGCDLVNWQMYFLAPDKDGFVGLHMGGYFGAAEQTNARVLVENEL